jgi:hypothetical protein
MRTFQQVLWKQVIKQEWRLKTLDIVTTAGSAGNIIAALHLPGTQSVGEDGRLFVRGGEMKPQTFVDGIRVAQPYNATIGNVPTRGRFSPFVQRIAFQQEVIQLNMARRFQCLLLNTETIQHKQNRNLFNDRGCRIRKYPKME